MNEMMAPGSLEPEMDADGHTIAFFETFIVPLFLAPR
jgi:hypothetical protein